MLAVCSKTFTLAEPWEIRPDGTYPNRKIERYKENARERFLSAEELTRLGLTATLIAVILMRSGALEIVPALSTLAGALVLACLAILLAFGAGIVIWRHGVGGGRQAVTALLIGAAHLCRALRRRAAARRLSGYRTGRDHGESAGRLCRRHEGDNQT